MTIAEAMNQAEAILRRANIASARLDIQILLEFVTRRDRADITAHPDDTLNDDVIQRYFALVERRAQREPLAHLTGSREFYGLEFIVTPAVLTPRAETEQMVELAVKYAPQHTKLIDIGTGCGAIAVSIAKHRPDLAVTATDITDDALAITAQNIARHQVQVRLVKSNLFAQVPDKFHTIVTNLPYLRDEAIGELMPEVRHEPSVALFGGPGGLDLYRRLFAEIPRHLEPQGLVFTECDPWQQADLTNLAAAAGLTPFEQDYFIMGFRQAGKQ
jgi:release factor glutamine methyltransferase